MRNNPTMIKHPTVLRRIRAALWLGRMEAIKTGERVKHYISNRKGNNFLRVDVYPNGKIAIWGDCSIDITEMVMSVFYENKGRVYN